MCRRPVSVFSLLLYAERNGDEAWLVPRGEVACGVVALGQLPFESRAVQLHQLDAHGIAAQISFLDELDRPIDGEGLVRLGEQDWELFL